MSVLARLVEEHVGDVPVAAVEGEIDASNAAEIRQLLHGLLTNRSTAMVVDLSGTRYLDSAGINLLFALGAELEQRQQRLHVVVPPASPIARAISITGLDSAVAMHAARADALARLAPP